MTTSGHSQVTVSVDKNGMTKIREALKRGLKMVGMQAESYAKDLCPVKTGNLRNSITYAIGGETSSNGEVTAPEDAEGQMTLYVGSNVEYAPYVELGHYQQPGRYVPAIGKRLVASYVAAKPFLRPAIENHAEEYNRILIGELNRTE